LSRYSEPLYASLSTTGTEENLVPGRILTPEPQRRIADPTPDRFSLAVFLEPEISRNQVTVDERPDKTIVLIHGDGLFDSAADAIKPAYLPILNRIAEGLEQTRGRIEVAGHSDNVPISTSRFPSNRSLSQARADEVVRILSQQLSEDNRLSAIGMADTQPVAGNDTPQGRAQNRRVEISVFERSRSS
jgi:type VI secretion system protein ImpK